MYFTMLFKRSLPQPESCEQYIRDTRSYAGLVESMVTKHSTVASLVPDVIHLEGVTEMLDSVTEWSYDLMGELGERIGERACDAVFTVTNQSARAVCDAQECPFYPNGPESTL